MQIWIIRRRVYQVTEMHPLYGYNIISRDDRLDGEKSTTRMSRAHNNIYVAAGYI